MRLVILFALLSRANAFAEAEHYEQVRVDAGLTGSMVSVSDRGGAGLVMEIKAMVHDNIAVGGRVEVAVMFGGEVGPDHASMDLAIAACGLLKAEYLFGDGMVRPFVGLGAGGYTIGAQTIDSGPNTAGIDQKTGRYIGVAPEVGIDIGRVRIAATYNAILGASLELHQTVGTVENTTTLSQNYLSLELSFRFGGQRIGAPGH